MSTQSGDALHSTSTKGIESAGFDLIVQNAEHLIEYIYSHTDTAPYSNVEIRVGLVVKILIKSNRNYSQDLLKPVINDIEELLSLNIDNPKRHEGLSMELQLLNKFQELDDSISLNTVHQAQANSQSTGLF